MDLCVFEGTEFSTNTAIEGLSSGGRFQMPVPVGDTEPGGER